MKSASLLILASVAFSPGCFAQNADSIAVSAAKSLRSAAYKDVQIAVRGDTVTLTGSVALYSTREDAEYRIHHIRGIGTIRNEIQVDAFAIDDRKLKANMEVAMATSVYRRLGSLPNLPNLISLHVHNGVVILEGNLPDIQLERDIFSAVAQTRGVREIIDRIHPGFNPELVSVWPPDYGTGEARGADF